METTKQFIHVGMQTPWGQADSATVFAPGIGFVGTSSHGGVKLDRKMNAKVPEYMRRPGGWYEEDCEWAIPFAVFANYLKNHGYTDNSIESGQVLRTLCTWFPDEFERFTGIFIQPGESYIRDKRLFEAQHKNDLQAVSAVGDWHDGVPKEMVGVIACVGGRTDNWQYASTLRYFLVPKTEYATRDEFAFIVDPSRYEETDEKYSPLVKFSDVLSI